MTNIRAFKNSMPIIGKHTYIDEAACIIGDVVLGDDCSVWPMVVIRGDVNSIKIGDRTNIQDGSILHVTHKGPLSPQGNALSIGSDVTIGHNAVLHACTIEDECLIGMGAIILDAAIIKKGTMIAAGSVVSPGKVLAGGYLYIGTPARQARELSQKEKDFLNYSAQHYVSLKNEYL